ncbi:hypothetical protein [Alkalihalobacillus sp. AL-G]|uniref:hypothetical protein n=1 Tax=Alkalihalobacillus sp. AL-G TaxID=2926399 RepID=UPI00272A3096|nr:hypothetical protein [Alkalihalobacillus sp. AL-G]WLD93012.1 hypothetical protein MOJ78_18740 [Alkalihalobacillus sp. AL-G]
MHLINFQKLKLDPKIFFFSCLLFLAFYNLRPSEELTTIPIDGTRIYFISLFLYFVIKYKEFIFWELFKNHRNSFMVFFLFVLLSISGYIVNQINGLSDEYGFFLYSFNFFFFYYAAAYMTARFFKDLNKFLRTIYLIVFLQSCLIILTAMFPELRILFKTILYISESSNLDYLHSPRAPGFTASSGAMLSFLQSYGIISLLMLRQLEGKSLVRRDFFSILIILVSCFSSGRTGFLISILILLFYTLTKIILNIKVSGTMLHKYKCRKRFLYFVLGGSTLTFVVYILTEINPQFSWYLSYFFDFIFNLSNSSIGVLLSQELPEMNLQQLIFGTHIMWENHDSGYVRALYVLGLPLAVGIYLYIFYFLTSYVTSKRAYRFYNKAFLYLYIFFICLIFLFELKEPFIWKGIIFFPLCIKFLLNETKELHNGGD